MNEIEFDKATDEWFKAHNNTPTTVERCEICGKFYKPSLGHGCEAALKDREARCSKEMIKDRFVKRLNKAVKARGLKWKDLAKRVGVEETVMSRYSKGQYLPQIEGLASMALALGVSTDYLLGLSDKEHEE